MVRHCGNSNHWLLVKLEGTASNRAAIGAKVGQPERTVIGILAGVKARGDAAVVEYSNRFDRLTAGGMADLELSKAEMQKALDKLGKYGRPMRRASSSMAHMYISDPIKPGFVERLFSTHPPIPKRVARLREIGTRF